MIPRRITAGFDKQRTELFLIDIEVVVVHVNWLVTFEP